MSGPSPLELPVDWIIEHLSPPESARLYNALRDGSEQGIYWARGAMAIQAAGYEYFRTVPNDVQTVTVIHPHPVTQIRGFSDGRMLRKGLDIGLRVRDNNLRFPEHDTQHPGHPGLILLKGDLPMPSAMLALEGLAALRVNDSTDGFYYAVLDRQAALEQQSYTQGFAKPVAGLRVEAFIDTQALRQDTGLAYPPPPLQNPLAVPGWF